MMLNKVSALILVLLMSVSAIAQRQIGHDILGKTGDYSGHDISLSADGKVLAITSPGNSDSIKRTGCVRIYQNINNAWEPMGDTIYGQQESELFGSSVSLNQDGSVLAIGAPANRNNGSESGEVRIFAFNNNQWIQVGASLKGEFEGDLFGSAVSINANGNVVAIGAYYNDGNGTNSGHVRVFKNNSGNWKQLGSDIDGSTGAERCGYSVALNAAGDVVVIGSTKYSVNKAFSGQVRVFQFKNDSWEQLGSPLTGEEVGDEFGYAVAINKQGNIIAASSLFHDGSANNIGQVRLFELINNSWNQIGSSIVGTNYESIGKSIVLSGNGLKVAIGAPYTLIDIGFVRVYQYLSGEWEHYGKQVNGDSIGDYFGTSVSVNSDFTVLAVGARSNEKNGENAGQVKVFDFSDEIVSAVVINTNAQHIYPNPASNTIVINGFEGNVFICDLTGKVVQETVVKDGEQLIDVTMLTAGVYQVHCFSPAMSATQKLIIE